MIVFHAWSASFKQADTLLCYVSAATSSLMPPYHMPRLQHHMHAYPDLHKGVPPTKPIPFLLPSAI